MDRNALKALLSGEKTPARMLRIGRAYLDRNGVRDPVAAEAWLQKVIDSGDPEMSPQAMGILAREILGREEVLQDDSLREICARLPQAQGEERRHLLALKALASPRQKSCLWYGKSLHL